MECLVKTLRPQRAFVCLFIVPVCVHHPLLTHTHIIRTPTTQTTQTKHKQEEQAKRAARAKKFGLPEERQAPLQYAPDPEEQKRAARAKKFGSSYEAPTADTLLQKAGVFKPVKVARLCYLGLGHHCCRSDCNGRDVLCHAAPCCVLLESQPLFNPSSLFPHPPTDLFEPRKDAPEDLPRREEAIYLYGVDVMSTRDCLSYFDDYAPTLVEWINDSSCECVWLCFQGCADTGALVLL